MEPLIHIIIPPLILMALFPKLNKKLILALFPFTFLMDFDFFLPLTHRFGFHNLFFVLLAVVITYIIINKKAALITAFYTLSHLFFDLQKPGVAFLYPLIKKTVYISTTIIDSPFNLSLKIGTMNINQYITESVTYSSNYLTTTATIFILTIIICIILFRKHSKK